MAASSRHRLPAPSTLQTGDDGPASRDAPVLTVSPDTLLTRDLTRDPPPGLPTLTPKQAAFVRRRCEAPQETLEATKRSVGYAPGAQVTDRVRMYLAALAAYRPPGALSAADQRRLAVDRLVRVIEDGDDREATMAAKVLEGYLPKTQTPEDVNLCKLSTSDLIFRLSTILRRLDPGLSYSEDNVSACVGSYLDPPALPTVGSAPESDTGTPQPTEDEGVIIV